MKNKIRITAILLAITLIISGLSSVISFAAPAPVYVEETMYVNLDYYGAKDKVSVVKSVKMNGNITFSDYGTYEDITNMSNDIRPFTEVGKVIWEMPTDIQQFHCQYRMNTDEIVLPWNFEVSYRLNGNPIHAENLRGASGLVEIGIKAIPNLDAESYYLNNMMLMVMVPVDYDTSYSVDAPGSQTQTVGGTSAVVFSTLPGSEGDYIVRIGTNCFESSGIMMSMIPGTIEDLERMQDLNDMKNTWRTSGDQFYDSMRQMMQSMEAMRSDITTIQDGLSAAESARQQWSAERDTLLDATGLNLEQLSETVKETEKMISYIEPLKQQAEILHKSMGTIVKQLDDMQDTLVDLQDALADAEMDLEDVSDSMNRLIGLNSDLTKEIGNLLTTLEYLVAYVPTPLEGEEISDASDIPEIEALIESIYAMKETLESLGLESGEMMKTFSNLTESGADSMSASIDMIDDMRDLIDEMVYMEDRLSSYYPEMQAALSDTERLLAVSTNSMHNETTTMQKLHTLLKSSSPQLEESASKSLAGTDKLLDKSLSSLDHLASMRNATEQMKQVLDQELDEMERDNNFLNVDPHATKLSFTSEKNVTPKTVQVVLRTAEISLDDAEIEQVDFEVETKPASFFQRLWNVMVALWTSTTQIFASC